jgi:exonuclease III
MERSEKHRLREYIGVHLDVAGTRLSDDEALFLRDFIDGYENYRGRSVTRESSRRPWSSDGRYTVWEKRTYTFTDDIGIRLDYVYCDDDGQRRESSIVIDNAREILDCLRDHHLA